MDLLAGDHPTASRPSSPVPAVLSTKAVFFGVALSLPLWAAVW